MDLSRPQRVLAFLAIVLVLAGTGVYLLVPGVRASLGQGSPKPSPSHPVNASPPPPSPPAPSAPAPTPTSTSTSAPDIYQWLPFSQAGLAKAASVTEVFGAAYGTYSYKESASSYAASMRSLAVADLLSTLQRGYTTPGVASQRAQAKAVYTGSAVINSLRTFGPSSLTFVVTINQALTTTHGTSQVSGQYAITVTNGTGPWLVNDIELASDGNE